MASLDERALQALADLEVLVVAADEQASHGRLRRKGDPSVTLAIVAPVAAGTRL
jgi:hypothetical protein